MINNNVAFCHYFCAFNIYCNSKYPKYSVTYDRISIHTNQITIFPDHKFTETQLATMPRQ